MLPLIKKRAAQAIVNVFETDLVKGDYGNVTVISGDTGELTYGKAQTTLASGNLYKLLSEYCQRNGSKNEFVYDKERIRTALPRFEHKDPKLNWDADIKRALHNLGADPVMQFVQDRFFDRVYWDPAMTAAETLGLTLPLSCAVVYDSFIHGAFGRVRKLFPELPPAKGGDECKWVIAYVVARRGWLLTNTLNGKPYKADDACVYRMDAFASLIQDGNWTLELPFAVRGKAISEQSLA